MFSALYDWKLLIWREATITHYTRLNIINPAKARVMWPQNVPVTIVLYQYKIAGTTKNRRNTRIILMFYSFYFYTCAHVISKYIKYNIKTSWSNYKMLEITSHDMFIVLRFIPFNKCKTTTFIYCW